MAVRLRRQGYGKTLVLGFGGDVSFGGLIDQALPNSLPDGSLKALHAAQRQHPLLKRGMRTAEVWGDCVGELQASVTAISLISPLTTHGQRSPSSGISAKRVQRAHPLQVEALVDANIDFVTLANGHSMHYQEEGLGDTWEALEAAQIAHAGSGMDRQAALRPAVLTVMGRKLAYFALSAEGSGLPDAAGAEIWSAAERRTGIWHLELWDPLKRAEALRELRDAVGVEQPFLLGRALPAASPCRLALPPRLAASPCRSALPRPMLPARQPRPMLLSLDLHLCRRLCLRPLVPALLGVCRRRACIAALVVGHRVDLLGVQGSRRQGDRARGAAADACVCP